MSEFQIVFDLLKANAAQLTLIGTAGAFLFGAFKFFHERREAHHWRQFEAYHKLVRELVEPLTQDQPLYIDRQSAVVYELRHFKRYYPHTLRMLKGLRDTWAKTGNHVRLITEMDLAIAFFESKIPVKRRDS